MGDVTPINILTKWCADVVKRGMSLQLINEMKFEAYFDMLYPL